MILPLIFAVAIADAAAAGPDPRQASAARPSPATLTLREALAMALHRSPLVEAARERDRAARTARSVVARAPNPFIEFRGENFGPSSLQLPRDVFATVSQPIELGGKHGARRGLVEAAGSVAGTDLTLAEQAATADVAALYIEALRSRDVRAALIEQRRGVQEIVSILAERVREGVTAESDLRKFETEQTRLSSQVTRAGIALESALLRLSAAIGEPLAADQLTVPLIAFLPPDDAPLTDASIGHRPDVRAAEARLQRADAVGAVERARGVPDVVVTAGYKRTAGFDTSLAAVTLPIAVFDRNRVAVAQAAGELSAARFELQLVRERALADARARTAAARQLAAQSARAGADLLTPAGIVRTAARAAFVEGRGDVLQLVDAERVFGDASREARELELDAILATIQARLALGEAPLP